MNSEQLKCTIRETRCLDAITMGVFSADTLPNLVRRYPSAYICNTDKKEDPGEHWVVFWFKDDREAEFYDSLGHSPDYYNQNFVHFIANNAPNCVYNNVQLQKKNYVTCGHHVLYYLVCKCRGLALYEVVEFLKQCTSIDTFVYDFVISFFSCL